MPVPAEGDQAESGDKRIVVVIGPGRSGTSTIAGALAHSGLEVPGRAIKGNETNPSGFFEPRWVVDFHRELLTRGGVNVQDTAPGALDVTRRLSKSQETRDTLRTWLSERLEEQPLLVVKDPRTVWFSELWVDVARDLGVEPGFVTMLRHPAEVSASRQKYYNKKRRDAQRGDDIARIAGWTNVALIAEEVSKGFSRAFVKYTDLVGDWRPVLRRVEADLGLSLRPPITAEPHPVDEFIDPTLHRVRVDWEDIEVPANLRDVAEGTWRVLERIAVDGETADLVSQVDQVRADYRQMLQDALAMQRHTIRRREATARRQARREARREQVEALDASATRFAPRKILRRIRGGAS